MFSQREVSRATGIPQPTISWRMRHLYPERGKVGAGKRDTLTIPDVMKMLTIEDLKDQGASFQQIRKVVSNLEGMGIEAWETEWLVVGPEGSILRYDTAKDALLRIRDSQGYAVDVAGLKEQIDETEGKVIRRELEKAMTA